MLDQAHQDCASPRAGVRVPDQNGAGIRTDGSNLPGAIRVSTIRERHLGGRVAGRTILIEGRVVERNGKCAANCVHGGSVNQIERPKVVGSTFRDQRVGHQLTSGALALEMIGSTIEDGPEARRAI
jgi:hypothetical protein